jgi:hypothetical protein
MEHAHGLHADLPENLTIYKRSYDEGMVSASSHHAGGVNGLLMDGSVRFFKDSVSLPVWRALATRSAGETLGAEQY